MVVTGSVMKLTRRDLAHLLVRSAALPGATVFFSEWLKGAGESQHEHHAGAPPEPDYWSGYQPQFFAPRISSRLEAFTEILIPTDETPGAREAHCAYFIDFVLASVGRVCARYSAALAQSDGFAEGSGLSCGR